MMANNFGFDEEKALNVFVYIAGRLGGADIYRIFKILYFADVKHLSNYGRPIVGDVYYALPKGPVPTKLYDDFKLANSGFTLNLSLIAKKRKLNQYFDSNGYMVQPKIEPNMDELSQSDIECIELSIAENKDLSFGEIKNKSHDYAYHKAGQNGPISFKDIAIVGGADDKMSRYIEESNKYSLYKPL